jgi:hypothetical protein
MCGAVSSGAWWALAYLVVVGSIIGYTAYLWLLHHQSPTKVGTYAYVNPVVAVVVGYFLGGEELGMRTVVGAALVVVSVVMITTSRKADQTASREVGRSGCVVCGREGWTGTVLPHENDGEYLPVDPLVGGFGVLNPGFHSLDIVAGIDAPAWFEAEGGQVNFEVVVVEEGDVLVGAGELELKNGRVTALDLVDDTLKGVVRGICGGSRVRWNLWDVDDCVRCED